MSQANTLLVLPVYPITTAQSLDFIADLTLNQLKEDTWTISNKYYTATVTIKVISSVEEIANHGEEPAIIILVSNDQVPSTTVSDVLKYVAATRDDGFEVGLLCSLPHSDAENGVMSETAWEDAAIDSQLEWVSIASTDAVAEEGEGKDKIGISRVREALHSHMWESLVRVERRSMRSRERIPDGDEEEEESESMLGVPPLPSPRPFIPTPLSFPPTFLPSLPRASSSTRELISIPAEITPDLFEDNFSPFVSASTSSTLPPLSIRAAQRAPPLPASLNFSEFNHFLLLDDDDDGEGEGIDDEEDEKLFSQLAGWREQAKGLGMEERRQLAEKVLQGLLSSD